MCKNEIVDFFVMVLMHWQNVINTSNICLQGHCHHKTEVLIWHLVYKEHIFVIITYVFNFYYLYTKKFQNSTKTAMSLTIPFTLFCLQIFVIFVVVAILTLGYCSDIKGSNTYQDTVYEVCGKHARTACAVSVLLYCFGTCITFLIIIGDQWEECENKDMLTY